MMKTTESIFTIANERMSIISACNDIGMDIPDYDYGNMKLYCPFGDIYHMDGGTSKSFRVYPLTNTAYCVDYETEILTARGWVSGLEVSANDLALTYEQGKTSWEKIQRVVRVPTAKRRMLSMETKTHSSLSTADHRWIVRSAYQRVDGTYSESIRYARDGFRTGDTIPYGGKTANVTSQAVYSDAFVELVAWFFTEGHLTKSGTTYHASLYQSHKVNSPYVDRIRETLSTLFGPALPELRYKGAAWREDKWGDNGKTTFTLSVPATVELLAVAPNRVVSPEFIYSLTESQLHIFVETALDADGARVGSWRQICQKEKSRLDGFQMAATLLGIPVRVWQRASGDFAAQLLNSSGFRPNYWQNEGKVKWVDAELPVWCVQTPTGSWVARRRGTVFVTGNCFACAESYNPVKLISMARGIDFRAAAEAILEETEYVPPDYASQWDAILGDTKKIDIDSLADTLKLACERMSPGWESQQYEDKVVTRFQKCVSLLVKISTEEEAAKWLAVAREAMRSVLGDTK